MKYQINKTNYRTFNIFQDNKLPGRSYFIPYPNKEECDKVSLLDKRYKSSKVICLNGDWDFKFYPYTHVRFSYGYTSRTMTFEIKDIRTGIGNPEWGAPDKEVFIIELGNRTE